MGSDIARLAREAGAKLLPGIFSDDAGKSAPADAGGVKASQAIADGDPAAAAEAALNASSADAADRPGPQAATGGRDVTSVARSQEQGEASREVELAGKKAAGAGDARGSQLEHKDGYEAHAGYSHVG